MKNERAKKKKWENESTGSPAAPRVYIYSKLTALLYTYTFFSRVLTPSFFRYICILLLDSRLDIYLYIYTRWPRARSRLYVTMNRMCTNKGICPESLIVGWNIRDAKLPRTAKAITQHTHTQELRALSLSHSIPRSYILFKSRIYYIMGAAGIRDA